MGTLPSKLLPSNRSVSSRVSLSRDRGSIPLALSKVSSLPVRQHRDNERVRRAEHPPISGGSGPPNLLNDRSSVVSEVRAPISSGTDPVSLLCERLRNDRGDPLISSANGVTSVGWISKSSLAMPSGVTTSFIQYWDHGGGTRSRRGMLPSNSLRLRFRKTRDEDSAWNTFRGSFAASFPMTKENEQGNRDGSCCR